MESTNDTQTKVRNFILENYLFSDEQSLLENSKSFLKSGIIDSMSMLEIVSFIEGNFSITVAKSEITPENLDSVNSIVNYILSKKSYENSNTD